MAPLEPLYAGAVALRGALYDAGWLAAARAPVPVISVGNLTAGGSGKSPMVAWIAGRLLRDGKRPAVVSRGYRGSHRGMATLVSGGEGPLLTAEVAGDEPVMLATLLKGVPVVVARRRLDGVRLAAERFRADCVVLDDGFQHRCLARDMDLVMVDGENPFGNGRLLPAGPLREPLSALRRASVLVVNRGEGSAGASRTIQEAAARSAPRVPVLHARVRASRVRDAGSGEEMLASVLDGMRVICLAGIARPRRFFQDARQAGARVVREMAYPDHHRFSTSDLDDVAGAARASQAEAVLTTEKDLARMRGPALSRLGRVLALCVEIEVLEEEHLQRLLREALR